MAPTDRLTMEWFGCATWRMRVGDVTVWLDTFMQRPDGEPPVGLPSDVVAADWIFLSHAHFDHMLGADVIARTTGATVVGNRLSIDVLRQAGVPQGQCWSVSGGEPFDVAPGVTVTAYPSHHSCQWVEGSPDGSVEVVGGLGIDQRERRARLASFAERLLDPFGVVDSGVVPGAAYSLQDGGQIMYRIDTPAGVILWDASVGMWSGIMRNLDADIALIAVGGRPTLDGEPFQGSGAQFTQRRVELLNARRVVFQHHDAFWPPQFPGIDTTPYRSWLTEHLPGIDVTLPRLGEAWEPFGT